MTKVETLEANTTRTGSFERGSSLMGYVTYMKENVKALNNSYKSMIQMVNECLEDIRVAVDVIRTDYKCHCKGKPYRESDGKSSPN